MIQLYTKRILYKIFIGEKYFCYFLKYAFLQLHKNTTKSYQSLLLFVLVCGVDFKFCLYLQLSFEFQDCNYLYIIK